jgi:hypothetical protein
MTESVQFLIVPMRATGILHLILNLISSIILNEATHPKGNDDNNSKNVYGPTLAADIQNR